MMRMTSAALTIVEFVGGGFCVTFVWYRVGVVVTRATSFKLRCLADDVI